MIANIIVVSLLFWAGAGLLFGVMNKTASDWLWFAVSGPGIWFLFMVFTATAKELPKARK